MSANTSIEWATKTWNPVRGCSLVSDGCRHCYAMKQAHRFSGPGGPYEGLTEIGPAGPRWTGRITPVQDALEEPLHWRKPERIFVNSMSDLFHEDVPDEFIDRVFTVMALCPQHTFQILTKRPQRMYDYFESFKSVSAVNRGVQACLFAEQSLRRRPTSREFDAIESIQRGLPNVWLLVSCENQPSADERIPLLLRTPAAVHGVSLEPLLGAIDLTRLRDDEVGAKWNALQMGLSWVIVGGESGPGARPMHPDWARSLRDQCDVAGVAFFFKQWGEWSTVYDRDRDDPDWRNCPRSNHPSERYLNLEGGFGFHGDRVVFTKRVGKKAAGRELDGRIWGEFPIVREAVSA